MKNHCKNLVIMCMDYRFQSISHEWLKHQNLSGQYDVISVAGSSIGLLTDADQRTFILNQINMAIQKHGIERIIIFHHEDCAAIGDVIMDTNEQTNFHWSKMYLAEKVIINHFPFLKVEKYFFPLSVLL